jgi:hypothetical protein
MQIKIKLFNLLIILFILIMLIVSFYYYRFIYVSNDLKIKYNKIKKFSYHLHFNNSIKNDSKTKYIRYECISANQKCGGWADRIKGIFIFYRINRYSTAVISIFELFANLENRIRTKIEPN